MSDILCIYYSRTNRTKKAVEEIGDALGAEVVRVRDGVERRGWTGWLRCGLDAMRKDTEPVLQIHTERPLKDYRLVIIGTPVWAGRCSAVIRSFLKAYGSELHNTAYVVTRGSDGRFEEIYRQMDLYVAEPHKEAVSLRMDSVGCHFWQEDFVHRIRAYVESGK